MRVYEQIENIVKKSNVKQDDFTHLHKKINI